MRLTDDELVFAQNNIDSCPPGDYELKELFGGNWARIESPTGWGKRFKEAVESGKLMRIELLGRDTKNHQIYRIK